MKLRRLTRKRATDEVYEALRDAILTRVFKPGQRLQVEEIAERLGVSLTPVRHAIQQLCTEGLIEIRPRSGTFVATLTIDDIQATFEVRCALECLAAELAVPKLDHGTVAALEDLLTVLRKPVTNEETLRKHEKANSELHRTLIEAAGNSRLREIYSDLNAHLTIARIHASESGANQTKEWSNRFKEEQAEHDEIVAALKARQLPRAQAALRKHIYRAKDAMMASYQAVFSPASGPADTTAGGASPSGQTRSRTRNA